VSSFARTWPAVTVWPTVTSTSASLPALGKLSGMLAGAGTGPVALTVTWSEPWLTVAVW
jgi:hypothetical protein